MFEIVKLTHICRYWRSTLISSPHLWSSIFVENDHRDFVAACLERSREIPLTVRLDLKYGDYHDYPDCTCIRYKSSGMRINEACRYHTTIDPLIQAVHIGRIRELDVHFTILDSEEGLTPDESFKDALGSFEFFIFPLPRLESLSFKVYHELDVNTHLALPRTLFLWAMTAPTELRHLALDRCYGGPILAISNLTSLELSGDPDATDYIQLNQRTFLPLIANSPSLVSLHLSRCNFPERTRLSRVTPVKLPELKSLKLLDIDELPEFSGLMEVPAFKTLSKLLISTRIETTDGHVYGIPDILVRAESDGGFQLLYDASTGEVASHWLGVTYGADPSPAFVRFEGDPREYGMDISPLPLYSNAKILEICVSFASNWYRGFWKDLEGVGPQLTTLRLEVTDKMSPEIARSVKKFVRARLQKGTPLEKLERMTFDGMSEEDEEKAKRLWEEFRAILDIDNYLVAK